MESFEIPGTAQDTALRFEPAHDGRLTMTVVHRHTGSHDSVILERAWLRPLAAWFAGEAEPISLGEDPVTPYSHQLGVVNDEAAVLWSTQTWARLLCRRPYLTARVTIGPSGKSFGSAVMLSPEARQDVAAYLRQTDAEHWTKSAA